MENVAAFNNELSGLYETKPPISKAKMASITKTAMRAIKFYKHVVQSVEKFISKCKPEYKVPGLYVIDSIVRQSRHQYGQEKDVFAPRFARNMTETFANLFRCAPEDKSRIIRVLNLWQKNNVFAPEVIQPIFDLADPNHPIYQMQAAGLGGAPGTSGGASGSGVMADMTSNTSNGLNVPSGSLDLSMISSNAMGGEDKMGGLPDLSNNNLKQLLNDPNVLRQLQTLQNFQKFKQQEDKQYKLSEMRMQEEAFEKHLQIVLKASSASAGGQDGNDFNKEVEFVSEEQKIEVINLDANDDSRSPTPDRDRYKRRRSSRSRSRSRERGGGGRDRDRRRRSRSPRSRSRSPRSSRRRSSRERDRSTRDREHERERRRKGLPDIKKEHLSVCSTTLWVGHLSKLVYQEELSDTFGEFGDIVSIDQIVPRGCAFIVMNRRQDAFKAMQGLKNHKMQGRAITISWAAGKGVKSKEWKDFWDLELGVTYIPWNKLEESTDFDSLEEGGMFDEDSMPGWMKDKINHLKSLKEKASEPTPVAPPSNMVFGIDTTQPPPAPPPGGPPPMMPMMSGQFSMAPPMSGPPPPRMLGPMGPLQLQGIPMQPNMVHGIPPPPHAMMMPTSMMPPNFPPIPGQMGGGTPMGPPPMGLPPGPGPAPFPPPSSIVPPPSASVVAHSASSDDQMDIEMDEDDGPSTAAPSMSAAPINFNQPPPPVFGVGPNVLPPAGKPNDGAVGDVFSRDRNRGPGSSRWGGRGASEDEGAGGEGGPPARWRENGGPGAPPNFSDGRGGRNMNMPPMDINNTLHRPDFGNDNRGGRGGGGVGGGRGGGNHNGDFYPNMQNRFNQPTSLMQMRIPPPNSFNPRMPGPNGPMPPMFMRAQGGPGGRQQGPGFFNPRNPFDRDIGRGGGGGGGRARGGGRGGRVGGPGGMGNWSDEEGDDGNNFKRRGPPGRDGPGGAGGNRFRDGPDDWLNRDRGGRRGGQRDRFDRNDHRENDRERDRSIGRNGPGSGRRNSRDDGRADMSTPHRVVPDTEDDWDLELQEYDSKPSTKSSPTKKVELPKAIEKSEQTEVTNKVSSENKPSESNSAENVHKEISNNEHEKQDFAKPANTEEKIDDKKKETLTSASTPLYDELPPPTNQVTKENNSDPEPPLQTPLPPPSQLTIPPAQEEAPQPQPLPLPTPTEVPESIHIEEKETPPSVSAPPAAVVSEVKPTEPCNAAPTSEAEDKTD